MTENTNQYKAVELNNAEINHPEWDEPIVCRVEVDLSKWLRQLTGSDWEVYSEDEAENCISFAMRKNAQRAQKLTLNLAPSLAEVTLYHNGYAMVDVDGQSLFDGSLTTGGSNFAHLTYYHADSGEKITLN
ncbi:MAG: hypothetical protein WBP13_12085 [Methylophilaceae bacterium]